MRTSLFLTLPLLLATFPAAAGDWKQTHMPWGDPDLQGTWTNASITLLQRPDEYPNLVLTEKETAAMENRLEEFMAANDDVPAGDLQEGDVGGYNSFWMDPGAHVARVNGEPRSSFIVYPEDGQIPYTLWGRGRFYWNGYKGLGNTDNPETRLLGERCMVGFGSTGGPPMLPVLYNNFYQIVQSPGHVMILVEMNHNVRTIRIDGQPLPPEIRPWMGDSIGHWEGDTLVVETSQFHPQQNFRAAIQHQVYMTEDSRVIERFTRVGEKEILYEFTVQDDDIYTESWRGEIPMIASEERIYEYACHEGNYALPGILSGARLEEQE